LYRILYYTVLNKQTKRVSWDPRDHVDPQVWVLTKITQQYRFSLGTRHLHLLDVCGDYESDKWTNSYKGLLHIIFVVDLACYDQLCLEDHPPKNCIMKSLALFTSIVNTRWDRIPLITLILKNSAQFESKLENSPLANIFPDYTGGREVRKATNYLIGHFERINYPNRSLNILSMDMNDLIDINQMARLLKDYKRRAAAVDSGLLSEADLTKYNES